VVGVLGSAFVLAIVFWLIVNLIKAPSDFFEVTSIGLTNGCVYALVALGYTLVYGILELINFAHGDVFMLGGMFTITIGTHFFNLRHGQGASRGLRPVAPRRRACGTECSRPRPPGREFPLEFQ